MHPLPRDVSPSESSRGSGAHAQTRRPLGQEANRHDARHGGVRRHDDVGLVRREGGVGAQRARHLPGCRRQFPGHGGNLPGCIQLRQDDGDVDRQLAHGEDWRRHDQARGLLHRHQVQSCWQGVTRRRAPRLQRRETRGLGARVHRAPPERLY